MEENRSKANVVMVREPNEELAKRITALVRRWPIKERDLRVVLRLTYVDSLRLKEIVGDLVKAGKLAITITDGQRMVSLPINSLGR